MSHEYLLKSEKQALTIRLERDTLDLVVEPGLLSLELFHLSVELGRQIGMLIGQLLSDLAL